LLSKFLKQELEREQFREYIRKPQEVISLVLEALPRASIATRYFKSKERAWRASSFRDLEDVSPVLY
jgi:hypothetical protein